MVISLFSFLIVSFSLFFIGVFGIILNRRSIILVLFCIELILLSVNLNLVFFSVYLDDILGQFFVIYILTVAASESAVGLALLVLYFRIHASLSIDNLGLLHGLVYELLFCKKQVSFCVFSLVEVYFGELCF
jgi:NADH-quinone oxidoreductase subunit K